VTAAAAARICDVEFEGCKCSKLNWTLEISRSALANKAYAWICIKALAVQSKIREMTDFAALSSATSFVTA